MINIRTININNIWQRDERIKKFRDIVTPKIKRDIKNSGDRYDSQDLEHQILFRITTYSEKEALERIHRIFDEQKYIVMEKMKEAEIPPKKLFQFGTIRKDQKEWRMEWRNNRRELYCIKRDSEGKMVDRKEVLFREITLNEKKGDMKDIIKNYHYIHYDRCNKERGMIFGFFLKGNKIPFAIEQIEPCVISRNYKKAVLMLSNINYHTTCELTRFYSVPNSPKNLVGILDKLVGRALRERGYEWMMTSVMPAFAKTKATIAGGINTPILAKNIEFNFFERQDGRFELAVNRKKEKLNNQKIIRTKWKLFPVIELIKSLKRGLDPNLEKNKLYYIQRK